LCSQLAVTEELADGFVLIIPGNVTQCLTGLNASLIDIARVRRHKMMT